MSRGQRENRGRRHFGGSGVGCSADRRLHHADSGMAGVGATAARCAYGKQDALTLGQAAFGAAPRDSDEIEPVELHEELAAALGLAAQVGRVTQQVLQSHLAVDADGPAFGAGVLDQGMTRLQVS